MRHSLLILFTLLLIAVTGCSPFLQTEPSSQSGAMNEKISPYDLLVPMNEKIKSELVIGMWSGSIEWNRRSSRSNQAGSLIPLTVQGPTNEIWSIQLSITQQKTEKGETLLRGQATVYANRPNAPMNNFGGSGGSYLFSGYLLVKIVKQVIIIRLYLSDGTYIFIKKCRIVLIFRSVWTGKLWGQSRIYNCSKEFWNWTGFGSFKLERNPMPILSQPIETKMAAKEASQRY